MINNTVVGAGFVGKLIIIGKHTQLCLESSNTFMVSRNFLIKWAAKCPYKKRPVGFLSFMGADDLFQVRKNAVFFLLIMIGQFSAQQIKGIFHFAQVWIFALVAADKATQQIAQQGQLP